MTGARQRVLVTLGAAVAWGLVHLVYVWPIRSVLQPKELDILLPAWALRGGADLDVVSGSIHGVEPGAFLVAQLLAGLLALGVVLCLRGGDFVVLEQIALLPEVLRPSAPWTPSAIVEFRRAFSPEAAGVAVILLSGAVVGARRAETRGLTVLGILIAVAVLANGSNALRYALPVIALAAVALGAWAASSRTASAALALLCLVPLAMGLANGRAPAPVHSPTRLWVHTGSHRFVERPVGGRDGPRGHSGFVAVVRSLDLSRDEAWALGFGYGLLVGSTWVRDDAPEPQRWYVTGLAGACDGPCREGWVRGVGCGISGLAIPPTNPPGALHPWLTTDEKVRFEEARELCVDGDAVLRFGEFDLSMTVRDAAGPRWGHF
jgi:hypothetical protein